MGWRDRDYSEPSFRESISTSLGVRRPPNGTLALLILQAAAFIPVTLLASGAARAPVSSLALTAGSFHPWAILTHAIATTSVLSVIFVLLALWALGARLEPELGTPRLLFVYLLGNLAGGAAFLGTASGSAALATSPLDSPSGALAGLCWLVWRHARHEHVQLLGRVTSAGRVFALCALAVVALRVIASGIGAAAWLAAVAAGIAAAVGVERCPAPRRVSARPTPRVVRPSVPKTSPAPPVDEPDIDDVLAKISRSGMQSLTDEERQRLEVARQVKLRGAPPN